MRRLSLLVVAVGLLVAPVAAAQQGVSSIQGHVVDDSGAVLPGAVVLVTHQQSGMFRQVVSNPDGSYFITGITPGTYRVTAELAGFRKYEQADVLLEVGTTTTLEIKLGISSLQENVTVTSQAPLIDVTSTQVSSNISEAELAALPIMNRNWLFAVALAPGIQIQSSTASFACESLIVGGGSNRSGNFAVDGGGNNDDYLGSSCGSQTRTALEAVQEFQVLTNQYDAEFGRTAGAVINAITKQGSNTLRGSMFGSYTDHRVTARDFFVAQKGLFKPETSQRDWGGTVGGPIVRDKAHFFYSLDRLIYADGRSNTFTTRPDLNFSNTQRMQLWNHMIRGDHQINANNTWSARYLVEYSPTYKRLSGRRTATALDQEFDIDKTFVGTWNSVFSNTRFNTLRGGVTYEANGFAAPDVIENLVERGGKPQNEFPPTLSMLSGFTDQFPANANLRINTAYEVSDSFSWFKPNWLGGDHDMKFGGQYIYSTIDLPNQTDMNGRFTFATDKPFNAADPSTYPERLFIRVPGASMIVMPAHVGVVFAQDKWQVRNVTLNMGVRYDVEVNPIDNGINPFFGSGSYAIDKDNFSPRFGLAWRPRGSARSLVRGGYGLYYDKVLLQTTFPFVTDGIYSSSFGISFPGDRTDPGPSAGRLPTELMLINGPVVNWAALYAAYPPGRLVRNTGTVYIDNPDREVPNTHQVTLGYERQIAEQMAVTVDYAHSWNRDNLVTFDLNPGIRRNTSRSGIIDYTDLENIASRVGVSAFRNPVYTRQNLGTSQFDGVNFSLEKRYSHNWAARVSYALGYARGNSEATQTFINQLQMLADPRLDLNYGPLDNDRRQNFSVNGRVEVPHTGGLTLSGVYRFLSGVSLFIEDQRTDADQNGRLFDPAPAGRYCGTGENTICVDNDGGRNGAKGPSFHQVDTRLGYRLRPRAQATLDLNIEIYNLFNRANFDNPSGDQRSPDFLRLTSLRGGNGQPRAIQFSVRYGF
jgi:carboxypeptidase family protein